MAGQRCERKMQGSFTYFSERVISRIPFLPFSNPAVCLQPPARCMCLWCVTLNCQITVMDANSLPLLPANLPSLCLFVGLFISYLPSFLLSSLIPFSPNPTRTLNPISGLHRISRCNAFICAMKPPFGFQYR